MVVDWEQETGLLMTSGDVRIIRIWDTDREMKVQVTSSCLSWSPSPPRSPRSELPRAQPEHPRLAVKRRQLLELLLPRFRATVPDK